jgi:hypothetical protein
MCCLLKLIKVNDINVNKQCQLNVFSIKKKFDFVFKINMLILRGTNMSSNQLNTVQRPRDTPLNVQSRFFICVCD